MLANLLSLTRIPLAFLMIYPSFRLPAIILACLSDVSDGAVARWTNQKTKLGTLLDPACDKFFVLFGLGIFFFEGKITAIQLALFLLRDIAIALFTIFLLFKKQFKSYVVRPFISGKIITSLQFVAFALLALDFTLPPYFDFLFILFGGASLIELLIRDRL